MAKNKKANAPQKEAPGQKGPGKPATTKPAPTPKETPVCPRCYENMDPMGGGTNHKISKCIKGSRYRDGDYMDKLWPKYSTKGDEDQDKMESEEDARKLMEMVGNRPAEYRGKILTKYLLEHAFRVVYDDRQKTLPVKSATKASTAGRATTASRPGASNDQSEGSRGTAKFILDFPSTPAPLSNEPQYNLAVHQAPNLDTSLSSQSQHAPRTEPGKNVLVATNFVLVNKIPQKLHMYRITFGKTERVRTKKEMEDDEKEIKALANDPTEADFEAAMGNLTTKSDYTGTENDAEEAATSGDAADSSGGRAVSQRSEKARIFKALAEHREFQDVKWATDYSLLWTLRPLRLTSEADCIITEIEYSKLSGRKHKLDLITFSYLRDIELGSQPVDASKLLLDVVETPDHSIDPQKGAGMRITALNAFITKEVVSRADVIPVGANKFFVKNDWRDAGKMLEIHRGYFTSIRPGSNSVLLNVNVATSAFYKPLKVSDFFGLCNTAHEAMASLKGLTVFIGYLREEHDQEYKPNLPENRNRVIAGFGRTPQQETFELHTGETISVLDYFRSLGYELQKPELPCISVNISPQRLQDDQSDASKQKQKGKGKLKENQPPPKIQWVPPELLKINPHQPYGKLLPPQLTDEMIKAAVRAPAKTQNMIITEGFRLLGLREKPNIFEPLQLELRDQLIQIPAFLLNPPRIAYKNNTRTPTEASWNLKAMQFFSPPPSGGSIPYPLRSVVCTIDFRTTVRNPHLDKAGEIVSGMMKTHGVAFANAAAHTHIKFDLGKKLQDRKKDSDALDKNEDELVYDILKEFIAGYPNVYLALVVLPQKKADLYGIIKRVCDQWIGLHTVCLVEESLIKGKRGNVEYLKLGPQQQSNLALKLNMKMRGHNHRVAKHGNNRSFFESMATDTMVIGADVSHAGSEMPFTPSVAAIVANDDTEFAHFPGSMRLQASTQEVIAELQDMVYYRLKQFHRIRRCLPSKILFYRDGVSEDQFEMCRREEIPQIYRAYQKVLDENANPRAQRPNAQSQVKLTFVVVGKRHHTRFFATREDQTWEDRNGQPSANLPTSLNGNVRPGLLVDQIITRPAIDKTKDFFLQSHAALHGTSRSGHYSVLEMDGFSLDQIKAFTHAFCYNYQRATKGVSYVGPAYYADRLCERGTVYLKAFTAGRSRPPLEMSAEQKRAKKEGAKEFAREVAEYISDCGEWNPNVGKGNSEPNPWHPEFDHCMFWL